MHHPIAYVCPQAHPKRGWTEWSKWRVLAAVFRNLLDCRTWSQMWATFRRCGAARLMFRTGLPRPCCGADTNCLGISIFLWRLPAELWAPSLIAGNAMTTENMDVAVR